MKTDSKLWTKNYILIIVVNFLLFCSFQMLMPTLPVYAEELGTPVAMLGLITFLGTIGSLIIRPFSGRILDNFGRKIVFLIGVIIMIISIGAFSLLPFMICIFLSRTILGFGWGGATTASNTMAADAIPKNRFGEGLGIFSLSISLALAIAPAFGLFLMNTVIGFHAVTICSVTFAFLALIFINFVKPKTIEHKEYVKTPLYEKSALPSAVMIFFICMIYGAVSNFISLFGTSIGINNMGFFFIVYALTLLVVRPFTGKLTDKKGFSMLISICFVTLLLFSFVIFKSKTIPMFMFAAVLLGIGYGGLQSTLQIMAIRLSPPDRVGAANATFFTGFDLGMGFGALLAGVTSALFGYASMYLIFGIFVLIAALLYFFLFRKKIKAL